MAVLNYVESARLEADAVVNEVLPAGEGWLYDLKPGQVLRILDLEGNQAADTLFFKTSDPEERYSATETILGQSNLYLSAGTVLRTTSGAPLLTLIADTCGRHDTLGGACSCESNTIRYAHDKKNMHACRDTFLLTLAQSGREWGKVDLSPNINFFMNVPVTPEGGLTFADGVSAPGRYVEMRAEMDVTVLISNCPQLNNPCNAYNPTPVRLLVWNS
jgi:urea carboxylase-associated protein 1